MSGGSLDYFYSQLECHVGDFNDKELDDLVKDLSKLFHEREWYLSSDTNEGRWREARDAFKKKWFGEDARKKRIEQYLNEIMDEVLDQFGVSDKYCQNCGHWTQDERGHYEEYGNCDVTKGCLMHRSESCDKFKSNDKCADRERKDDGRY
jgi:hypothetical protein